MKRCGILLLVAGFATAESFSYGLKAGVPLNPLLSAAPGEDALTHRYTLGPSLEVGISRRWAVSADLLYKVLGLGSKLRVNRWEAPLLLKYRFAGARFRPF